MTKEQQKAMAEYANFFACSVGIKKMLEDGTVEALIIKPNGLIEVAVVDADGHIRPKVVRKRGRKPKNLKNLRLRGLL